MIFLPKKSLIATKQDFSATGGNSTVDGIYNIHTFTSSGSLVIEGSRDMDILIVAGGGGGGGGRAGGGGGAGGVIYKTNQLFTAGTYNITVGNGGGQNSSGGSSSIIGPAISETAVGGGRGGGGEGHLGKDRQSLQYQAL